MRRRKQLALNGQAPTPLIMCNWKWRTVGHTIYGDMPRCNRNPSPDELAVFGCCDVAQLPKLLRLFGLPFFVVPPPHGSWFHLLLGSNFIFIKNNTVQFLFIEIGSQETVSSVSTPLVENNTQFKFKMTPVSGPCPFFRPDVQYFFPSTGSTSPILILFHLFLIMIIGYQSVWHTMPPLVKRKIEPLYLRATTMVSCRYSQQLHPFIP